MIITDNFNREALGSNWTQWIVSNFTGEGLTIYNKTNCRAITPNVYNAGYWNANVFANDQYSKIKRFDTGSSYGAMVAIVRCSVNSAYFLVASQTGGNTATFRKIVAGGPLTVIGSSFAMTVSVGSTCKLEAIGTTLKAYLNDVEVASVIDSDIASGQPGVGLWNTLVAIDEWEGGDISSTTVNFPALTVAP
jgi:hypothetical protein